MTDEEMIDKIKASLGKPMGFVASKDGVFLTISGEQFEVTDEQGAILWDLLPQIAGYRGEATSPDS